ncbi:MAG: TadE family protein [Candidatus Nanopelagicales bacterium]
MAGVVESDGGTANGNHLQFRHPADKQAIVRRQRREARKQKRIHRKRSAFIYQQNGMVTAEFAVVLMAVSVVMIMVIFAATVGVSYVQTQDAARQAARLIARGESQSKAVGQAKAALPSSRVAVDYSSDAVSVHVTNSVTLPIAKVKLGGITVSSTAHAPREHDNASTQR